MRLTLGGMLHYLCGMKTRRRTEPSLADYPEHVAVTTLTSDVCLVCNLHHEIETEGTMTTTETVYIADNTNHYIVTCKQCNRELGRRATYERAAQYADIHAENAGAHTVNVTGPVAR